jgi:hypothetical protein
LAILSRLDFAARDLIGGLLGFLLFPAEQFFHILNRGQKQHQERADQTNGEACFKYVNQKADYRAHTKHLSIGSTAAGNRF